MLNVISIKNISANNSARCFPGRAVNLQLTGVIIRIPITKSYQVTSAFKTKNEDYPRKIEIKTMYHMFGSDELQLKRMIKETN